MVGKRSLPARINKLKRLYIRDSGRCWICGEWGTGDAFNRDHLIPRSLGGTDGMWNLRLCHPKCNSDRGVAPPPLGIVLQHCRTIALRGAAIRLYYAAYPRGSEIAKNIVKGRAAPAVSVTPGPLQHKRFPSQVCSLCDSWCGVCNSCWCTATENDHDVLLIRKGGDAKWGSQ